MLIVGGVAPGGSNWLGIGRQDTVFGREPGAGRLPPGTGLQGGCLLGARHSLLGGRSWHRFPARRSLVAPAPQNQHFSVHGRESSSAFFRCFFVLLSTFQQVLLSVRRKSQVKLAFNLGLPGERSPCEHSLRHAPAPFTLDSHGRNPAAPCGKVCGIRGSRVGGGKPRPADPGKKSGDLGKENT